MTLGDLTSTPFTILVLAAFSLGILTFAARETLSLRFRRIELEERRAERRLNEERARAEQAYRLQSQWFSEQQQRIYAAQQDLGPDDPTLAGDYFTFIFDRGGDIDAEDFDESVGALLKLPMDIAYAYSGKSDVEVRVHRFTYRNPLIITLLVVGASTVVGAVVLGARRINVGIQEIRQSITETAAVQAGHRAEQKREEFAAKLFDRLAEALDAESDELVEARLDRLRRVSSVAVDHGLLAVSHREVTALEADSHRRQLGLAAPKAIGELGDYGAPRV